MCLCVYKTHSPLPSYPRNAYIINKYECTNIPFDKGAIKTDITYEKRKKLTDLVLCN